MELELLVCYDCPAMDATCEVQQQLGPCARLVTNHMQRRVGLERLLRIVFGSLCSILTTRKSSVRLAPK